MKQFSIQQYVLSLTLIPALIIAVSLGVYILHDRASLLDDDLMERGKLIARQLASGSEYGVFSNNLAFLQNLAQGALQQPDMHGVTILNATSEILIELEGAGGKPVPPELAREARDLRAGGLVNLQAPVFSNGKSLWVYQPIIPVKLALDELDMQQAVQQAGAVIIEMDWAGTQLQKRNMYWVALGAMTLLLSLSSFLLYLASRRIASPVRELSEAVQRIGRGHLETRVPVTSHIAELSSMAQGINAMAYAVQSNSEALRANNLALEDRVAERTALLDNQNAQITKSLSLLQATLESTHDAILAVDLNNNWVLRSQRFIDLWHITDEIIAAGDDNAALAYVLDQVEDADGFLNRVRELYATPEASSFDMINFKDGRIIERYSIPQLIDCKVVGRVWSFRDITGRKLVEEELRQAKELAESAARLKDQFVTLISHDLRSPLLSIKGMLDMAKAENPDGLREMDQSRTLDRIAKSTGGLIALIEHLLDHSRLQSGSMKPEMRFINARSLVEEQIGNISHLAHVKNITIQNTLPGSMHLYADPDLYGEVLHNLLSNAIKFTRNGGNVDIFSTDETTVAVRDDGVGIDEKMLPDLFNIGVKTTTYGTDEERGSGLGLPYSHDIMKAHGGSLTAVPIKGAGTEFHVTLPRHDILVLIVDDQDIQRAIMKEMIAKLNGVQVVEAHDGAEALEMLQHITPAIIITDIQMPVMDGFELVRQIRNMPQYEMVPIMAVTAFAGADSAELREKLLTLGADDFIAKPLAEEAFLPVVARYLGIAWGRC